MTPRQQEELEEEDSERVEQEPEFSRRAARVMNSPYWKASDKEQSDSAYLKHVQSLRTQRQQLIGVLRQSEEYDDLGDNAKKLFDTAEKALTPKSDFPESKFQAKRKSFTWFTKDKGGPCKPGQNPERDGCVAADGESGSHKPAPEKRAADRSEKLVQAKREGKGKDAKVLLADGQVAPPHITPAMVPPAWSYVKVSMNPDADILVSGKMKDKKGKWVNKVVYHPKYLANNQAAKFAKIAEGLSKMKEMEVENQRNRQSKDESIRECADVVWLMQEQATRPGSEADTKGLAKFYGQPMSKDNVVIKKKEKVISRGPRKGEKDVTYSVFLKFGDKQIPIRDEGTKMELVKRAAKGEGLEDSTYWLKSHGATTLEGRNVVESEDGVRLVFVGKESILHNHLIRNPELAKMLVQRKKTSEQRNGQLFGVTNAEVGEYTGTLDGGKFTPKDLRTLRASKIAIDEINKKGNCCKSEDEYKQAVLEVATKVSGVLGNRPEQAIESYILPSVWSTWRFGQVNQNG